jgi:hypothetical protein
VAGRGSTSRPRRHHGSFKLFSVAKRSTRHRIRDLLTILAYNTKTMIRTGDDSGAESVDKRIDIFASQVIDFYFRIVEVYFPPPPSALFPIVLSRSPPGVDVMITIFCDFCQFSAKKLAFFSKTDVMIKILHNLALF